MGFNKRYLKVTTALDREAFIDATEVYVDLLKTHKDKIINMTSEHIVAKRIHEKLAFQYALQKILIQRVQGKKTVSLDLSLFTRTLPFQLKYDSKICSFLKGWKKDASLQYTKVKNRVAEQYIEICKKHLNDMASPDVIDGDVYLVTWVLHDFLKLERFLPERLTGYVNLGCGCGLFDSAYLQAPRNTVPALLIDTDPNVNSTVTHLADINGLSTTSFSHSWPEDTEPPSFILSIRSCGYLYSVETYDSLFSSLRPGSRVLLDVKHELVTETTAYFEALGARVRTGLHEIDHNGQFIEFSF
jgi:hypothetical protein